MEGFIPIAVRDDHLGCTVVSQNPDTGEYMIAIDGMVMGPMRKTQMETLQENIKDVLTWKGPYHRISEYSPDGSRKDAL